MRCTCGARRAAVALRSWPRAGAPAPVRRASYGPMSGATARVRAAEGYEVHLPRTPRCCGALQLHSGEDTGARSLAKATIESFERFERVVVNAAGCGSAMKDY